MAGNVIPFQQLREGQQGIVCDEVRRVNRGWKLETAKKKLIKKVNDIKRRINQRGQVTEYYIGMHGFCR